MSKVFKEFKQFAFKGNVIDLAVGVMIGGAFGKIVTSVVNDLFTPLIAAITGGVDFTSLAIKLGEGENAPLFAYGSFIQTVFDFLLMAVCIFLFVKAINKLRKPVATPPPARVCPFCKLAVADDATRCPHCTSVLE